MIDIIDAFFVGFISNSCIDHLSVIYTLGYSPLSLQVKMKKMGLK